MDTKTATAEIRRELQLLLSEERDLIQKVENATASGDYRKLRDLADELVRVAEHRADLRARLVEAQARDRAAEGSASPQRKASDVAAETWRLLR